MSNEARKSIADLLAVMAALRTPGSGCPWDLEQNFRTIAPYTIEEAYEVADAIERGDMGALEEELGDLLLQVVYHARMAEEQRAFAFADVVDAITQKDDPPPPARVRQRSGARRRRGAGLLGAHQGRGDGLQLATDSPIPSCRRGVFDTTRGGGVGEPRRVTWRFGRRPGRPARPHACRQVAEQSRQGRLRLALARTRVRQAEGGAGRARAGGRHWRRRTQRGRRLQGKDR